MLWVGVAHEILGDARTDGCLRDRFWRSRGPGRPGPEGRRQERRQYENPQRSHPLPRSSLECTPAQPCPQCRGRNLPGRRGPKQSDRKLFPCTCSHDQIVRRLGLLLAISSSAVACAAAGASGGASRTTASPIPDGGIHVVGGATQAAHEMDLAAGAGLSWIAMSASWATLEPTPGADEQASSPAAADWADLETRLQAARSRGLSVLLVFSGAPTWSGGAATVPPTASEFPAYAAFLGRTAARLSGLVSAYAIWDEPNLYAMWQQPDASVYTQMQKLAYPAIKAADPSAIVVAAPLAPAPADGSWGPSPYDYLIAEYQAGIAGSFDVLGWNAYAPGAPEDTTTDSQGRPLPGELPALLYVKANILDTYDPGRKIWLTELGWSTCTSCDAQRLGQGNIATEAQQADYLVRSFTYRRRYLGDLVPRIFIYQLRDVGTDVNNWEDNLGIVHNDWTPKPAYQAIATMDAQSPPPTSTPPAGQPSSGQPSSGQPPAGSPPAGSPPSGATPPSGSNGGKRHSVTLTPAKLVLAKGFLILTLTVRPAGGTTTVQIDGYRRHWLKITQLPIARSSLLHVRIRDRGYTALRIRASLPGSKTWAASRTIRVPATG